MESNPGAEIGGRGCAVPSSGSPTATPIRFNPKSKARTVRSGMPCRVLQSREIEAEELHRAWQALLRRHVEEDRVARLDREPRVLRQLVLELARGPAGVPEGHQHARRPFAAADRLEDVLRRGE